MENKLLMEIKCELGFVNIHYSDEFMKLSWVEQRFALKNIIQLLEQRKEPLDKKYTENGFEEVYG